MSVDTTRLEKLEERRRKELQKIEVSKAKVKELTAQINELWLVNLKQAISSEDISLNEALRRIQGETSHSIELEKDVPYSVESRGDEQ